MLQEFRSFSSSAIIGPDVNGIRKCFNRRGNGKWPSHILGFSVISLLSGRLREKKIQRGDHLLGQVSFNRSRTGKLDFSLITFSKLSLSSDEPIENEIWRRDPLSRQVDFNRSITGKLAYYQHISFQNHHLPQKRR